MPTDRIGRNIVNIYGQLKQIAKEELHPDIDYRWFATWYEFYDIGNWLTSPDATDYYELKVQLETELKIYIPNEDAQGMNCVGDTVKYLWKRCNQQSFALRSFTSDVCPGAFIYNELRRFILMKTNISRDLIKVDASLGQLMPSWCNEFWVHVQAAFGVRLRWVLNKKRVTIRHLVKMIVSSMSLNKQGSHENRDPSL